MQTTTTEDREPFFHALKDIEQQHTTCVNKAKFITNVVQGKEQITFVVIDRCREAVLQLRQCHHVLKTLHHKFANTALGIEHKSRLDELAQKTEEISTSATEMLDIIIAWVPAAVNTRATENNR